MSDRAEKAIQRAEKAVGDLCAGRLRWEMRVPAEPDHDPDLIISNALREARALLDENERLRDRLTDQDVLLDAWKAEIDWRHEDQERLRAALKRLVDMDEAQATSPSVWGYAYEQARAALEPK